LARCLHHTRILRPCGATRFPYTTLFRSGEEQGGSGPSRPRGVAGACHPLFPFASADAESILEESILELRDMQPDLNRLHRDLATDRKSTRLNSSHQIISYAVFCLNTKRN